MLSRAAAVLALSAALVLAPVTLAAADDEPPFGQEETAGPGDSSGPGTGTSGGSSGGSIQVTVSQSGSTSGGRTFSSTTTRTVAPLCWMGRGPTGYQYYEYWKLGGKARESDTLDDYANQGLLHQGWEDHATDTEGHWYESTCSADAPGEVATEYHLSHPAVWVGPTDPVPPQDAEVDPEVLAEIASDSMDLPRGTIRWNPSMSGTGATVVGTDTWVWVEDAATTVSVTAQIPSGTWARVDAVLSALQVSAPGADSVTCPDTGTPWGGGAASTTCSLRFFRSSANQAVKAGHSQPTATLTAQATWTASWVSSEDPNPTALPAQTISATAEVPVAEIQGVVSR
ncbi:hypothetical protein ACFO3K_12765 [Cellulomonas algicola]|uniref:ATP/GTP-binding protein n=1 Tax=Cellulomonas algicola TaxID=2071633 RepID=A0A401V3N4_9CELL|nr:hypothetical protein [Cellulomonas algicola]GCD21496.1 hypothetical protein CTKZ_30580 [Cellulomonas algicola]